MQVEKNKNTLRLKKGSMPAMHMISPLSPSPSQAGIKIHKELNEKRAAGKTTLRQPLSEAI